MHRRTELAAARARRTALLSALVLSLSSGAARAQPAGTDVQRSGADTTACASCHGERGGGLSATGAPRLAGLPEPYLRAQLDAFAAGTRQNVVMAPLARSLTPEQRAQLAQVYASQPWSPSVVGAPASNGAELALRGRWSQGVPACVKCHAGRGVGLFPPLTGQTSAYLAAQLAAFKAGTRHGDALGLMDGIASKLTDADIQAVSAYFASQPGALPGQSLPTRATAAGAGSPKQTFQPADTPITDAGFRAVVQRGLDVFENPRRYAGRYVGNDLSCSSCHLDAGRQVGSAPMWAAYVSYPAYRSKTHQVNTFAERLQGCFEYSMNGRAPPLGDPILVALESYAYWMARGAPVDPNIPGRGYPRPGKPAQSPDAARGAQVYAGKCALCHGANGDGQHELAGGALFPALWGRDSYNWGAGMANVSNAAAFIKSNMPFSQGSTLSDQEAWDVAWFIDSRERPQDPRYTGSVARTRAQFHDTPDSLYGQEIDGHRLGSRSPPPGGHKPARPARQQSDP
jgi:thiosulfate dehydrogenase